MNLDLHAFILPDEIIFLNFSVSQDFKNPKMSLEKPQILPKSKILPKSSKVNKINIGLCDNNFIDTIDL